MSTNGVGSSVPFWYTRTTPPLRAMNIRPSGAKAIPVANGRLLATMSSTKPDGVKVMSASDRTGLPTTPSAARRATPHTSRRLDRPWRAHQLGESDLTLISKHFLSFISELLAHLTTGPMDGPCRLPASDSPWDGPNPAAGLPDQGSWTAVPSPESPPDE